MSGMNVRHTDSVDAEICEICNPREDAAVIETVCAVHEIEYSFETAIEREPPLLRLVIPLPDDHDSDDSIYRVHDRGGRDRCRDLVSED
jgi:hypothetical protein